MLAVQLWRVVGNFPVIVRLETLQLRSVVIRVPLISWAMTPYEALPHFRDGTENDTLLLVEATELSDSVAPTVALTEARMATFASALTVVDRDELIVRPAVALKVTVRALGVPL